MLNKEKRKYVYMDILKNDQGFTLIHYLFLLSILTISFPFVSYLLQAVPYPSNKDELSIQTFIYFIRDDAIRSTNYQLKDNEITLYLPNGDKATISKYNHVIRRQVNGEGHEIYVMNIQDLSFKPTTHGFRIRITSMQGEIYEKSFSVYK